MQMYVVYGSLKLETIKKLENLSWLESGTNVIQQLST